MAIFKTGLSSLPLPVAGFLIGKRLFTGLKPKYSIVIEQRFACSRAGAICPGLVKPAPSLFTRDHSGSYGKSTNCPGAPNSNRPG